MSFPPTAGQYERQMRGFLNLDGHQSSFIHMDLSAIPQQ
jgi:hypothetical protein